MQVFVSVAFGLVVGVIATPLLFSIVEDIVVTRTVSNAALVRLFGLLGGSTGSALPVGNYLTEETVVG
ncbi:MAG: hypothetical protein IIB54_09000 [Planctomycetes bacterium]|nr:hypothetical protein [Planctomycetota bacterium]